MSLFVCVPPVLTRLFAVIAVGCVIAGCGSPPPSGDVDNPTSEAEQLEVACELALVHLDTLIDTRSRDGRTTESVLIEAREMRDLGRRLYLEREYSLALELLEEGIKLLEAHDD